MSCELPRQAFFGPRGTGRLWTVQISRIPLTWRRFRAYASPNALADYHHTPVAGSLVLVMMLQVAWQLVAAGFKEGN